MRLVPWEVARHFIQLWTIEAGDRGSQWARFLRFKQDAFPESGGLIEDPPPDYVA